MYGFLNLFAFAVCTFPISRAIDATVDEDAKSNYGAVHSRTAEGADLSASAIAAGSNAFADTENPMMEAGVPEITMPNGANFNELIKAYNNLVHRLHHLLNTLNYEWRDIGISPIREYRIQQTQGEPPLNSIVTDIPLLGVANPANFNNDDIIEVFRSMRPIRTPNGFRLPGIGEIILEQPNILAYPPQFGNLRWNFMNNVPPRFIDIPELGPLNPRTLLFTQARSDYNGVSGSENAPAEAA